jgi:hypothetical protein
LSETTYLVRTRTLLPTEAQLLKPASPTVYPQREAVLFALRDLTGVDAGQGTRDWQQRFPNTSLELQADKFVTTFLQTPEPERKGLISLWRDCIGDIHTHVLARLVREAEEPLASCARSALVHRLTRLGETEVKRRLSDPDSVLRVAARAARDHAGDGAQP